MALLDLQTGDHTANPKSISVSSACNHEKVKGREILDLPREVVTEIFLQVPWKNLIRLARVCKLWHSIIFDPDFVKAQVDCAKSGIIFGTWSGHYRVDLNQNKLDTVVIAEKIQLPYVNLKILDSCRGLLLLTSTIDFQQLYICNPATRRCKSLPVFARNPCGRTWSLIYDTYVKKYKVLGISKSNKRKKYLVVMLTLGAAETVIGWRELVSFKSFKASEILETSAVGENELHWLEVEASEPFRRAVCSLDITKEESTLTTVPSYVPQHCLHLVEVRGSVCLMNENFLHSMTINAGRRYGDPVTLQVWVLEDRVNCQWTRMYNISVPSPPLSWPLFWWIPWPTYAAMRIRTSDSFSDLFKVLLIHENQLFLFDLRSQELRQVAYLSSKVTFCDAEYQSHINDSLASWD